MWFSNVCSFLCFSTRNSVCYLCYIFKLHYAPHFDLSFNIFQVSFIFGIFSNKRIKVLELDVSWQVFHVSILCVNITGLQLKSVSKYNTTHYSRNLIIFYNCWAIIDLKNVNKVWLSCALSHCHLTIESYGNWAPCSQISLLLLSVL